MNPPSKMQRIALVAGLALGMLSVGCGRGPDSPEDGTARIVSAFTSATPIALRLTTLAVGTEDRVTTPSVSVGVSLPGGGGQVQLGRYTPGGVSDPQRDFACPGGGPCALALPLHPSDSVSFPGVLPAGAASAQGSVGLTLVGTNGTAIGAVTLFALDGHGLPDKSCVGQGSSLDGWDVCWDVAVNQCAPGQTDWWCCSNTGRTALDFNVSPSLPDDAGAGDCRPTSVAGAASRCSLRGAVQAAELSASNGCQVTARLAAGQYALGSSLAMTGGNLTLQGSGMGSTVILTPSSGAFTLPAGLTPSACAGRPAALYVDSASVTLADLTLQGSSSVDNQGICFTAGDLTLTRSRVTGFSARGVFAVPSSAQVARLTLSLDHALVDHNRSHRDGFGGAGIYYFRAAGVQEGFFIAHSTISNNVSDDSGGGIRMAGVLAQGAIGNRHIQNTTISDNSAALDGGGLHLSIDSYLELDFVTIAFNHAGGTGGGVYKAPGTGNLTFGASIVTDNTVGGDPQQANLNTEGASSGNNSMVCISSLIYLSGSEWSGAPGNPGNRPVDESTAPDSCEFGTPSATLGDLVGTDDGFNSLPMRAPKAGSHAIDTDTFYVGDPPVADDERGSARPLDPSAGCSPRCDRGAFEFNPTKDVLMNFEDTSKWTSTVPLSLSATRKTAGNFGLNVGGAGYRVVNSRPFPTPLSTLGSTAKLDVFVPGGQPNPYWLGAVQMYASCPSAGVNNAYLGQAELTGKPVNSFSMLSYSLPAGVRTALGQAHSDCFFSVAVNMNQTPTAPVLDNLRLVH